MRRLIRIVPLVCHMGAALCLALALLMMSTGLVQAGFCFAYCPNGDCETYGIPPVCKDKNGVQQTCNTSYPGCGGCNCMQKPNTDYCACL